MAIERAAPQASVAEVLDRVLDRGIVIDAWLRVSVAGIALIDVDARVVVASISTYVRESEAVAWASLASRPAPPAPAPTPPAREAPPPREPARPAHETASPAGGPERPAAADARRRRRARRRRGGRRLPPVTLRCPEGCTFTRAASRCPVRVRCPAERGATCPVAALVPAAV